MNVKEYKAKMAEVPDLDELGLHQYESESSMNFDLRNASIGKALAYQQICKNAYLQIYKYAPTAIMRQLLDAADFVKDASRARIGFLTLRPVDEHCIVGSPGLDDFIEVVRRLANKKAIYEIVAENFESVIREGTDVELWHYHCVFTFGMNTNQSTLYTTLSRGFSGYLFESKHSVCFKKSPMRERSNLCSYVLKERRAKGPLPTGGSWRPLIRKKAKAKAAAAAQRGDAPPDPPSTEVDSGASVDAPFTGLLESLF